MDKDFEYYKGQYKDVKPTFPTMSLDDYLLSRPPQERWKVYRSWPELKSRLTRWERIKQEWKEFWNPRPFFWQ